MELLDRQKFILKILNPQFIGNFNIFAFDFFPLEPSALSHRQSRIWKTQCYAAFLKLNLPNFKPSFRTSGCFSGTTYGDFNLSWIIKMPLCVSTPFVHQSDPNLWLRQLKVNFLNSDIMKKLIWKKLIYIGFIQFLIILTNLAVLFSKREKSYLLLNY